LAKKKLIELDIICRRYSRLPSDILKLEINDYQFCQLVAGVAIAEEQKGQKNG